jgi:hypothetical protein
MYDQILSLYGVGPMLYHYWFCVAQGMEREQALKWCIKQMGEW